MAGYVRQSTIADGNTIDASLFNNEFDALLAAFVNTTGHKHDGTAANGPVIGLIGDAGLATPLNKILIDTTNNHLEFNVNVGGSSVNQINIQDGLIKPITTNDIDLGTSTLQFKDGYFDGNVTLDGLVIGSATAITDVDTDLSAVSGSDDTVASAKAIKTYVDAQVGGADLDFAGDSGGNQSVDLDAQSLTLTGGTGIDTTGSAQTMTFAIDTGVVVDKTTAQTLTNKTLTTPTISSITNGGTVTIPSGADTLVARTSTDILTNKTLTSPTLTSPVINTAISGTAFKDEDNMSSDSATSVASQQSIKAYVDTQVATIPTGDITEVIAGTGLSGGGTTGAVTLNADVSASSTNTFTNKTIDADGTGNNITNIENANIKSAAAIDATKIADGSVTSTEFQYINSLSSNAQTQIDTKAPLASPALTGNPTAPTQSAGDNSTKLATTAYVDNSTASRDQLGEMTDVTLSSVADANYFIYDNAASVWKNKAISGAITSDKEGVTTLASGIDATKIADGSVTSTEFQYINSLSSNAQTQIDGKQATIDASNRLNANLIHDGSVDNTEFGYLNGVTSAIQTQIDTKASAGFAVAMAIAL
jgi:hypothetical protein